MWPWQTKTAIRYCDDVIAIMQFLVSLRGCDEDSLTKALKGDFIVDVSPPTLSAIYTSNHALLLRLTRSDQMLGDRLLLTLYGVDKAAGLTIYIFGLVGSPKEMEISFVLEVRAQPMFRVPGPTSLAKAISEMLFMDKRLDIVYSGDSNYITLNKGASPVRFRI